MSGPGPHQKETRLVPRALKGPLPDLVDPRDRRLAEAADTIIALVRIVVRLGLASDDMARALGEFDRAAQAAGVGGEDAAPR